MRIPIAAAVGALVVVVAAAKAMAAEPPPPPGERRLGPYHRSPYVPRDDNTARPDYVSGPAASRHHHDGFYFRFAGGVGGGSDAAEATSAYFEQGSGFSGTHYSASGTSFAGATEVALGVTLLHGLALGVGAYTATLTAPQANSTGVGDGNYTFDASQLALFSPVIDWYVMPNRGFHAEFAFGLATYVAATGVPRTFGPVARAHTAVGTGFVVGVGYEWWVSDEWGVGALGRVLRGGTDGSDADGVSWSHTTTTYALMLSATYN